MNKKRLLLLIPFAAAALVGCSPTNNGDDKQCESAVVTVERSSATLRPGDTLDLKAKIDKEGCTIDWGSDNETVATVENGVVTAHANGTAHISANGKAVCTITVSDQDVPVESVYITTPGTYATLTVEQTLQIVANVKPTEASDQGLCYSSQDESIATVSNNGLITAVKAGTTKIVVSAHADETKFKEINLTVNPKDVDLPSKTTDGYDLVQSGELKDGDELRFVGVIGDTAYGMMAYASGNNHKAATSEIGEGDLSLSSECAKFIVVKNADGSYSFKEPNGKYVAATGGKESNYMKTADSIGPTSSFNVTVTNGIASIVCIDSNTTHGTMMLNSKDKLFSCYTSTSTTGKAFSLYAKTPVAGEEVVSLSIEGDMTKKEYAEGEDWSFAGLDVYGTTNLGNKNKLSSSEYDLAYNHAKPVEGDTSVEITATYKAKDTITVTKTIEGITVSAPQPIPVETELELTAGSLGLGSYSDGSKDGISWTMLMKGANNSIQGNSKNSSKIWNIRPFSKPIAKITLTMEEDKDSSTATLNVGDQEIKLGKETDYLFKKATPIVITPTAESKYFELTFTSGAINFDSIKFEFAAEEKVLTKIEVQTPPSKTEYYQGDTLNTAGMVVMGTYEGEATPVDVTSKVTVSPTVLNTIGDSIEITVTLGEQHDTFNVKVSAVPTIQSLTIDADDMNKDYKDGETISLEGVEVYANYEGGGSALLTSDKYTLTCDPTEADYDSQKTTLTASLVDTSAGVPDATLDVTLNVSEFVIFEKATDIAVGDIVALVNEEAKKEMTSVSDIGVVSDYTDYIAHSFELEVVAGSQANTFAFKNGDKYLNFTGTSNKLYLTAEAVTDASSWTVEFSDGNVTIKNVAASTRFIQYNASSPRFVCYTSAQKSVQLYKAPADPAVLQEIVVSSSEHREFYLYDEFVPETIMAKYDKGADVDVTDKAVFEDYDMETAGEQKVKVSYGGKETSYDITVLETPAPAIKSISIDADDMLTEYYDGDDIDLTGVKVYAHYESGDPVELDASKYSLTCSPEKADIDLKKTTLTATLLDTEAGVEPATLDVDLSVTAKTLETTLDFTQIEGFGDWTNSYSQHVVEYEDVIVTFDGASKQGATITDRPVGKDAPVTIVAKEGKNLEYFSAEFAQWNTNSQTVNVQYSTDYGEVFVDLDLSTSTFAIAKTNLPKGTSAIRFKPVNSTQMGYTSVVTNVIAAQEPDPVAVTGVSLDNEELTIAPTKTEQLVATIAPINATNKNVVWSVIEGDEYVSVDQTGLVTGLKVGEGIVQVETLDGGFKATCAVTVSDDAPTTKEATLDLTGTKTSWDPLTVAKGESATYTVGEFEFTVYGGTASTACTANYSESYRTYSGSYIEISLPSDSKYASFASMTMNAGSKSASDNGGYKISASTIDDVTGTIKAATSSPAAVVVSDLKGATVIRVSCTSGQLRYVSFNFVMNLK